MCQDLRPSPYLVWSHTCVTSMTCVEHLLIVPHFQGMPFSLYACEKCGAGFGAIAQSCHLRRILGWDQSNGIRIQVSTKCGEPRCRHVGMALQFARDDPRTRQWQIKATNYERFAFSHYRWISGASQETIDLHRLPNCWLAFSVNSYHNRFAARQWICRRWRFSDRYYSWGESRWSGSPAVNSKREMRLICTRLIVLGAYLCGFVIMAIRRLPDLNSVLPYRVRQNAFPHSDIMCNCSQT